MQEVHVIEEPRWHAALAALAALALYITLPPKLTFGPYWLLPLLVFALLVPLLVLAPRRHAEAPWQRAASIAHIAVLNLFNVATLVLMTRLLLSSKHGAAVTGTALLLAAVQIWLTNLLVYALWFWEIDGGGPDARADAAARLRPRRCDYLFPQMTLAPDVQQRLHWRPHFIDYVFLSFTNATAFSPTDTFPLTPVAKLLMMGEGLTSLVTLAVIAGRAVNILA